jgi:hypothetical protein
MALDPKKLQEAKRLLADLEKAYKTIGDTNPFKNIPAANADLDQLKQGLKDANEYIALMDSDAADLVSSFKAITEEVGRTNKAYGNSAKSINSLTSLAGKLRDHQQGINTLSSSQLKTLQSKLKSEQANLESNRKQLETKTGNLATDTKNAAMLANVNGLLEDNDSTLKSLEATTKKELKEREKIEKSIGVTGGLLRGMSKIPLIGDLVDTKEALEAAEETVKETGSGVRGMGAAFKTLGNQAASGLLNTSNMILGVFTFMVKSLMDMDKNAGKMAKSLNISYENALDLDQTLRDVAVTSGDTALSSARLGESLMSINSAFGTTAQISNENLATFTKLREQAGMTNEELVGVYQYSALTGKSMEDVVNSFQGSAKAASFQSKVALNTKKLMADISKISSRMKLSIDGGADGLANAAVNAKLLGADIDKVSASAEALLNFEQSIEDELSAELLLGKNINLEKARTAALNNDIATLSSEIKDQVGSAAEFGDMNRIQQEAIAKSVGMSADSLADMLFEQEALASLGQQLNDEEQRAFEAAKEKYGIEEASRMLQEGQLENLVNQQSTAEQFSQTIEHLKEIFVSIVDGPLGILLNGMASLLSNAYTLYPIIAGIGAIISVKMVKGMASFGKELVKVIPKLATMLTSYIGIAAAWAVANPIMAAVGLALAAGVGALVYSQMKDGVIGPGGETIVSGPKGSIQLDKEDSMIVGTNLMGDKNKSKSKTPPPPQGGGGGTVNVDMTQTNALLQQLINVIQSGGTVTLDGQKVGEALKLGSFQTQ